MIQIHIKSATDDLGYGLEYIRVRQAQLNKIAQLQVLDSLYDKVVSIQQEYTKAVKVFGYKR